MLAEIRQSLQAAPSPFSRMGRYITTKILGKNKINKSQKVSRHHQRKPEEYLKIRNQKISKSTHEPNQKYRKYQNRIPEPSIGYYKVKYNQVDNNIKMYNFNRSVPHFSREKFFCNEVSLVDKNYPDSYLKKGKIKGLIQLDRIPGRQQIKKQVRVNPHEKRFQMLGCQNMVHTNSSINIRKNIGRKKSKQIVINSIYECNFESCKKRLDTHIVPFQLQLVRDNKHLDVQTGISEMYKTSEDEKKQQNTKNVKWKKILPRQKTGHVPSYMDKNINSRIGLDQINLKTLQMNCTQLKRTNKKKTRRESARQIIYEPDYSTSNLKSKLF